MFAIQHLKRVVAACMFAAGAMVGLPSEPAQAQTLDTITCTGSQTTTFDPPISDAAAVVSASADAAYGPCVSTIPGITSGARSFLAQINLSCSSLIVPAMRTLTINWNNGQSSTLQVSETVNVVGALYTVTQTGTVTGGVFAGSSVVQQLTAPSLDITLCTLGLGDVSTVNFTNVLEIL